MNPTPSAARRYVCNNCAATKAGKVCEDCTMHGCQCPCQTHPRYEDENGKFWDYNPQTDKWDILLTNPTDGVPISEEFVRFADANAIGNAVLDALRSIPTVRRATGRTIPDLTKREHVCEYQSAVKSADPATPGAADRAAAEEIMHVYATKKSGWSGDLAAIISKHMAAERERARRMEQLFERYCVQERWPF